MAGFEDEKKRGWEAKQNGRFLLKVFTPPVFLSRMQGPRPIYHCSTNTLRLVVLILCSRCSSHHQKRVTREIECEVEIDWKVFNKSNQLL